MRGKIVFLIYKLQQYFIKQLYIHTSYFYVLYVIYSDLVLLLTIFLFNTFRIINYNNEDISHFTSGIINLRLYVEQFKVNRLYKHFIYIETRYVMLHNSWRYSLYLVDAHM